MANDRSTAHYYVIAMRIEFGAQDLHIGDAASPERPQHIANEYMLDNLLTESRMREVTIFRRHGTSRYRE
jgi:hypothetical protein